MPKTLHITQGLTPLIPPPPSTPENWAMDCAHYLLVTVEQKKSSVSFPGESPIKKRPSIFFFLIFPRTYFHYLLENSFRPRKWDSPWRFSWNFTVSISEALYDQLPERRYRYAGNSLRTFQKTCCRYKWEHVKENHVTPSPLWNTLQGTLWNTLRGFSETRCGYPLKTLPGASETITDYLQKFTRRGGGGRGKTIFFGSIWKALIPSQTSCGYPLVLGKGHGKLMSAPQITHL